MLGGNTTVGVLESDNYTQWFVGHFIFFTISVKSDTAGGKILHEFYIPNNISKIKDGLNFKKKDWYDLWGYKGLVNKLMNDFELW